MNDFEKNGYVVVENFLSKQTTDILYEFSKLYVLNKVEKFENCKNLFSENWDGKFGDPQCFSYSEYGNPIMDSILKYSLEILKEKTKKNLIPTYSYWRFYEKDDKLEKHIDRESCEISATINLGYDYSNLEKNKKYIWPIFLKNRNSEEVAINLNIGDMLIYSGCELEHWRDNLKGLNQTQLFIHYNDENGRYNMLNDGRKNLGLPKPR
jgi:hypothetical protein